MALNPVISGSLKIATGQVSVPSTGAIPVVEARSSRRGVIFQNLGANSVYLGEFNVTTANGYLLPPTANASVYIPTQAAIYAIASSTESICFMEVYD